MPVLHHEMAICRNESVDSLRYTDTPAGGNMLNGFFHALLSGTERGIIDDAVEEYGGWTGPELGAPCREPGSPWDKCHTGEYGTEVPDSVIRQYYESEMVVPELLKQDGLS